MTSPALRNAKGDYTFTDSAEPFTGVTKILRTKASTALDMWKAGEVAWRVATDTSLSYQAGISRQEAGKVGRAIIMGTNPAAELGTLVHALTEALDTDEDSLPSDWQAGAAHAVLYEQLKRRHSLQVMHTEVTVRHDKYGYAGTLDRVYNVPGLGMVVADLKTGARVYSDVALQLAAYANATSAWTPDGEVPLPTMDTTTGVVIHVTADKAEIIRVDLTEAFQVFVSALVLYKWEDYSRNVLHPYTRPKVLHADSDGLGNIADLFGPRQ